MKLRDLIKYRSDYKGNVVVHISDTPLISFAYVKKIIRKLSVNYLIHTGDFIDELKSTHPLFETKDYEKALDRFIKKLRTLSIEEIYLIPGNNDNPDILEKYKNEFNIVKEGSLLKIENVNFSVAHDYNNLKEIPEQSEKVFYLYGHNRYKDKRKNFLNGYCHINVIFINVLKVYRISYPFFVNVVRESVQSIKIGL